MSNEEVVHNTVVTTWDDPAPVQAGGGGGQGVVIYGRPSGIRIIINATPDDATTCPGCRVAVPLGQFCKCPVRWRG